MSMFGIGIPAPPVGGASVPAGAGLPFASSAASVGRTAGVGSGGPPGLPAQVQPAITQPKPSGLLSGVQQPQTQKIPAPQTETAIQQQQGLVTKILGGSQSPGLSDLFGLLGFPGADQGGKLRSVLDFIDKSKFSFSQGGGGFSLNHPGQNPNEAIIRAILAQQQGASNKPVGSGGLVTNVIGGPGQQLGSSALGQPPLRPGLTAQTANPIFPFNQAQTGSKPFQPLPFGGQVPLRPNASLPSAF